MTKKDNKEEIEKWLEKNRAKKLEPDPMLEVARPFALGSRYLYGGYNRAEDQRKMKREKKRVMALREPREVPPEEAAEDLVRLIEERRQANVDKVLAKQKRILKRTDRDNVPKSKEKNQ